MWQPRGKQAVELQPYVLEPCAQLGWGGCGSEHVAGGPCAPIALCSEGCGARCGCGCCSAGRLMQSSQLRLATGRVGRACGLTLVARLAWQAWRPAGRLPCIVGAWLQLGRQPLLLWQRRLRLPQLPRRHGCIRSSGLQLRAELLLLLAVGLMRWTC